MNIWIINLKPDDISLKEVKDYFFQNNIAGMGWRIDNECLSKDEYLAECDKLWTNGYKLACENYFRIKQGDLCLANNGVIYYIGMVMDDEPKYATIEKFEMANKDKYRFGWYREVKWYSIGRQDETPAVIVAKQSSRNQKTIDVRYENNSNASLYKYCRVVFNAVSGKDYFPIGEKQKMTCESFAECLSAEELEDLVGLFLQEKYGYIFYPSSCKTATKDFEFIMVEKETRKLVYTQVKQNAEISISHYAKGGDYKNSNIFLFSNRGYSEKDCITENIHLIDKEALFTYFKENMSLFQKRLRFDLMVFTIS